MTGEVVSEVSLCTCLYLKLRRPGAEGWGGAGVEPAEWVVEAGRTTAPGVHCGGSASRPCGDKTTGPECLGPRGRSRRWGPRASVPSGRLLLVFAARAARRQPLLSPPLWRVSCGGSSSSNCAPKRRRTRPNRTARVRGSINCKWTAGVLETSKLGLEEASEVITQGPKR